MLVPMVTWFVRRLGGAVVLAGLLSGCSSEQKDTPQDDDPPQPELEQDEQAFLEQYEQVRQTAAQMDPAEFLATYPKPPSIDELGYDPTQATGLDAIEQQIPLSDSQKSVLAEHGFVVLRSDEPTTPEQLYHRVYDADLPVLITTDSISYALHRSFDSILAETERAFLAGEVDAMLAGLHTQLGKELSEQSLPESMSQAALELDVYLTVARSLLAESGSVPSVSGGAVDGRIADILAAAEALQPSQLRLFDVAVTYDYSQLKPRGHYEDDPLLQRYFKAMMWLGRTDLPIVTFPEGQTTFHRRAFDAAVLIDHLMDQSDVRARWQGIDTILQTMLGEQDSMGPGGMRTFLDTNNLSSLGAVAELSDAEALEAIMGRNYGLQRIMSQIMFTDPQDPQLILPRVYLLMGQRFTLDSYVFNNVTYDRLTKPGSTTKLTRMVPDELDVQFVLGNDTAAHLLAPGFETYPYQGVLHELRFLVDSHPEDFWRESFYNGWLATLRALNAPESERSRYPEPMRTQAWQHKTLATQTASRAELRHDTLLYAKQSYSGGIGCEYIDAYVEPAQGFYEEMKAIGALGGELADEIEAAGYDFTQGRAFFENWSQVMGTLASISAKELDGVELSGEEIAFLGGAIEQDIVGCGEVVYDGWYASLFFDRADVGLYEPTIADVHTAPTDEAGNERGWVLHTATGPAQLMVFTVPSCDGETSTAYVGPVSSPHQVMTENYERLADSEWTQRIGEQGTRPEWVSSFTTE